MAGSALCRAQATGRSPLSPIISFRRASQIVIEQKGRPTRDAFFVLVGQGLVLRLCRRVPSLAVFLWGGAGIPACRLPAGLSRFTCLWQGPACSFGSGDQTAAADSSSAFSLSPYVILPAPLFPVGSEAKNLLFIGWRRPAYRLPAARLPVGQVAGRQAFLFALFILFILSACEGSSCEGSAAKETQRRASPPTRHTSARTKLA